MSLSHFAQLQRRRLKQAQANGHIAELRHCTRNTPRRADEIVAGGSIYWVIAGRICARQYIVRVQRTVDTATRPRCVLVLNRKIVAVEPEPHRLFQGWRYLEVRDAPPDLSGRPQFQLQMPPKMAEELRSLGLL